MFCVIDETQGVFLFKTECVHVACALIDLEGVGNIYTIGRLECYEDFNRFSNAVLVKICRSLNNGQIPANVTRRQLVEFIIGKIKAVEARVVTEKHLQFQCDYAERERKAGIVAKYRFKPWAFAPVTL